MKGFITAIIIVIIVIIGAGVFLYFYKPADRAHPTATPEPNIVVTSPVDNASVTSPITVTGRARVFESTFSYRLKSADGKTLYEGHSMTHAPDIGQFGDFTVSIPIPATVLASSPDTPPALTVEVFDYSAKDGSIENLVVIPVTLASTDTTSVKAYFMNAADAGITCTRTVPVARTILKTPQVGFMALYELLEGPTQDERFAGVTTTIPENVQVNSLRIENATAYADFNEGLDANVAGSCRVGSIRAQIEDTLKQFPTVKTVVISIHGRTEDVLQP